MRRENEFLRGKKPVGYMTDRIGAVLEWIDRRGLRTHVLRYVNEMRAIQRVKPFADLVDAVRDHDRRENCACTSSASGSNDPSSHYIARQVRGLILCDVNFGRLLGEARAKELIDELNAVVEGRGAPNKTKNAKNKK